MAHDHLKLFINTPLKALNGQSLQGKQQQLLEPIYRKVDAAIQAVAKENGYTYVFNREALLVMPPADDLLPLVAKRLNVKIPPPTAGAPRR